MRSHVCSALCALLGLSMLAEASAQMPQMPYQEHATRIRAAEMVQGLESDLFGESVNLYNGTTEFSNVDIDLPGNNALPVRLGRRLKIERPAKDEFRFGGFGSWDIDIPHVMARTVGPWGANGQRCSSHALPPQYAPFGLYEIWSGAYLHIPGGAGGEVIPQSAGGYIKPTDGHNYLWATRNGHRFRCTTTLDGNGEGFIVVDPQGIQYTFNVNANRQAGTLTKGGVEVARTRHYLLVSRIQDRHGNWVDYHYSGDKLQSITSSDGRSIQLTWSGNNVIRATAHGREWGYTYGADFRVTQPDGSQWRYQGPGDLHVEYPVVDIESDHTCSEGTINNQAAVLTITHPSGAVGTFEFTYARHHRSGTPANACVIFAPGGPMGEPPKFELVIPDYYDVFSIGRKTISGPGLAPLQWEYSYEDIGPGRTALSIPCMSCRQSKAVTVSQPDGSNMEYEFGVLYEYNDGRLLGNKVRSQSATLLRAEASTYVTDAEAATMPFTNLYGDFIATDDQSSNRIRPIRQTAIEQQGVTFSKVVNSFDAFARPLSATQSSTLPANPSRTEVTAYHDNLAKWVLGQASQSTVNGVVASETSYDANAQPTVHKSFGKTVQTLAWNADGTLATARDGNDNTTTLASWKRGIPQSILYADGTSHVAVVNDHGWITRITDQNGFPTDYTYDPMGRLASIVWPSGDSTAWNTTTQVFEPVGSAEHGIPPGHWRQTVATGNARRINYFDALWRPLVSREYDTGNQIATTRFQRFAYDHDGRTVFASYPGTVHSLTAGTWTEYDALGRTTSVSQDSELGPLATVSQYQSGFTTRVTNPNGHHTTTHYLAWGQPTYEHPVAIAHPAGAFTDIARDAFGKPTALTRRNSDGAIGLTRRYVYDAHQHLCKSIEPETGATVMAYDGAGNLSWSASGQGYPSPTACNTGDVAAGQKVVRTYDARNRLKTLGFPDGRGNQAWTYTPDGLPSQIVTDNANGADQAINGYTYNRRRLPVGETVAVGAELWELNYSYSANGHLAGHTYPSGLSVPYAPNALGQPTQAGTYATAVSYFPNGAIKQFTYGNGIVHSLVQNARGLPGRSRDVYSGFAFHDDSLEYDANGNVLAIRDGRLGRRGNRDMAYDALDRLVSTGSPMFGTASYSYDVLDNLKTVKLTAGARSRDHGYVYDANWRLTSVTDTPGGPSVIGLGYDARGNLSSKNGQAYVFDHGNRLREATGLEQYRYDGHGRRVQATRNGASIYSFYDQGGVLRHQRDDHADHRTSYVYLGGSLVAQVKDTASLPAPILSAPASSASGSYTVSWTPRPGTTRYQLQERFNGGAWSTIHDASGTSKAVSGRATGSWSYQVRACGVAVCGNWSAPATVAVGTPELPPTVAPTLTAPGEGPNGNYTVSWTSVAGASSYTLEESINGGGWTAAYTGSALSMAFSARPVGSYAYRVKACNSAGCGPVSAVSTVQVVQSPGGGVPTLTVPATSSTGSYTVSWTSVPTATRYELEERFNGGGWSRIHDAAGTSIALSGRAVGTWDYRVRACAAASCGGYSSTGTVQVASTPPSAPVLTVPPTSLTGDYTVSWTSVPTATRYELQERLDGGGWTTIHELPGTSKALSGKATGAWGYQVRACNAGGCGPYSAVGTIQVTRPPATPTLSAPASSSGSFTVSWNAVPTATGYRLQERLGSGGWTTIHEGADTSKAVTGKAAGNWGYQVQACNAAGCGAYSAEATVAVLAVPAVPQIISAHNHNTFWGAIVIPNCSIQWFDVATATSYELKSYGGLQTLYIGPDTLVGGAQVCGPTYIVRACNGSGCSAWSSPPFVPEYSETHIPGDGDPTSQPLRQGVDGEGQ